MKRNILLLCCAVFALVFAEEGARYLIITTDALAGAIQPLAEWKHFSGMKCKVVTLSQIGGTDTTAIKNYIRNAYNNWPIRPEYVLLVGSPSALPSRYYIWIRSHNQRITYYTDNFYGDINGDLFIDIPVGRFPAKSARQCSVMVAKTLAYERYPELTDSLWLRKVTTIVNEGGDSDDTIYWNDVRILARNFLSCDSLSRLRGDTATDVVNSVTNGTGMVMYRGTGVGNWREPFDVNPALTNNGKKLPVVLSITCATMSLAPNETMVGDAWVKAGTVNELKGAVAFFGNTHSLASNTTTVRKRSAVARAFTKAVFEEGKTKLGRAMIQAKESLYRAFRDTFDYHGFNLLGDPDLDIWTSTPKFPQVEHPATIPPGSQEFAVVVFCDGQPVPNALVCVSMDTSIYEYGYTDNYGAIAFNINPLDTGRLRLVVTGHNLYPYDTLIPVAQVGIQESPALPASAHLYATPRVFRNTTRLTITRAAGGREIAIFNAAGRLVRRLNTTAHEAIWDGTDNSGKPCPPGVYICGTEANGVLLETRVLKVR